MSSHTDIDKMRKLAEIKDDESDEDVSDTEAPDLLVSVTTSLFTDKPNSSLTLYQEVIIQI